MEQEEVKGCRWCRKVFSHDIGVADDPPLWMFYYCSELCRLTDIHAETGLLLMKIRSFLDGESGKVKQKVSEIIDSYEEKIRYEA